MKVEDRTNILFYINSMIDLYESQISFHLFYQESYDVYVRSKVPCHLTILSVALKDLSLRET